MEYVEFIKMADPRWRMVPVPSYVINNVIVTSLLLLKVINVLVNFLMLSNFLLYLSNFPFMVTLRVTWIRQRIEQCDVIMTSNYVILSITVCLDIGNDEYIILGNFGGRIIRRKRKKKKERKKPAWLGLFKMFLEKACSLPLRLVLHVHNSSTFISWFCWIDGTNSAY